MDVRMLWTLTFVALSMTAVHVACALPHSTYRGFAEPLDSYNMNSAGYVLTPSETTELSISASDFAVYRYGYVSYEGGQWQRFELSGNVMGGDWLNGSVSAQVQLNASDFGLSESKTSASRNFVVIYSCSRTADAWDCHNGWQIIRFDASLADQSPSWMNGLVSWWKFEGDAVDSVGDNDGTVVGAQYTSEGLSGGAYDFDGDEDYVISRNSDYIYSEYDNYSFAGWFLFDDSGSRAGLIGFSGETDGTEPFCILDCSIAPSTGCGLRVRGDSGDNPLTLSLNAPLSNGRWYHLALTKEGSAYTVYVDGQEDSSATYTTTDTFSERDMFSVGIWNEIEAGGSPDDYFDGKIDEVMLWNRSLTPEEVDAVFSSFGYVYVAPVCGNGDIETGEVCDDGNTESGDGCSGSCSTEAGWTCTGEPSACEQPQMDLNIINVANPGDGNSIDANLASAISQASKGDVVLLPAGNFILQSTVHIDKFISLVGKGIGAGGTKITKATGSTNQYMLQFSDSYQPASDEFILISGIYLKGYDLTRTDSGILMKQDNFVVTNCRFEYFGYAGINVWHDDENPHGLLSNNEFVDNCRDNYGYGVAVYGRDMQWTSDPDFGSDRFIFIEDNYFFEHRHSVAGGGGGKYVARYNTIIDNICQGGHPLDMHEARCVGLGSGNQFSTRATEMYGNNITNYRFRNDGGPIVPNDDISKLSLAAIGVRGGESLIWNNTMSGFADGITVGAYPKSECGSGSYPTLGQIGYLSGLAYGASHTGTDSSHGDGDVFEWDNHFTNYDSTDRSFLDWNTKNNNADTPGYLLNINRDYHLNTQKPGYVPYQYPHPWRVSAEHMLSAIGLQS